MIPIVHLFVFAQFCLPITFFLAFSFTSAVSLIRLQSLINEQARDKENKEKKRSNRCSCMLTAFLFEFVYNLTTKKR